MRLGSKTLAALLLTCGLGACGTYLPLKLDPTSNRYPTGTHLSPDATLIRETGVDPREFKVVLLMADTNVFPKRFEFFARTALFDLGLKRVLNGTEIRWLLEDRGLGNVVDDDSIRRLSASGLPVLVLELQSRWDGSVTYHVTLRATDGRNGKTMLSIDHRKVVRMDVDPEAHLPVFNALRQWYQTSSQSRT